MSIKDGLRASVLGYLGASTALGKGSLSDHSRIETAIDLDKDGNLIFPDENGRKPETKMSVVSCKDGSVYTMIRFSGTRKIVGNAELASLIEVMATSLSRAMGDKGHAMEVYFSRNPDDSKALVSRFINVQRNVADAIGLNIPDIFSEDESFLPRHIAKEDIYFVLWTRRSIFSKEEMEQIDEERREETAKTPWGFMLPKALDTQNPDKLSKQIISRHIAYCNSFMEATSRANMVFSIMSAHETMAAVRASLYPDLAEGDWEATLPGDMRSIYGKKGEKTMWVREHVRDPLSAIMWPKMDEQLFTEEAEKISSQVCRIGGNYFATADVLSPSKEMQNFQQLLYRVTKQDAGREFPWRFSIKIEGNGLAGTGMSNMLASVLAITTPDGWNRNIQRAVASLQERRRNGEDVVRARMSMTTWAPVSAGLSLIERRLLSLTKASEGWGKCRVGASSGDPVAAALGTVVGLTLNSTAPAGSAPLKDMFMFFPWARDVSPWKFGGCIFRTNDSRPFPFEPGSDQQTTWNYFVIAPPGCGKSVWLATTNLASCLSPRTTEGEGGFDIPIIRGLDIGFSQQGFCSIIRDGLPANRKHEVLFCSMRMTEDYAINPFDTPLGCRIPITTHAESLQDFLCMLAENDRGEIPEHMDSMIADIVAQIYRIYSDKELRNNTPKSYERGRSRMVDEAIDKYGINTELDTLWWDIVDRLALDHNEEHLAHVAQRFAVPQLRDFISFHLPDIEKKYGEVMVGATGINIIKSFQLSVNAAVTKYPILACPTMLDVTEAKIAILDIKDICGQSGSNAAIKQTSIAYSLGMIAICASLYQRTKEIDEFNPDYRDYHMQRLARIQSIPKRIIFDEYHETKGSGRVRNQTTRYLRTGRKYNIMLSIVSQALGDYDEEMLKMASGIWIMGCEDREIADITARLELSPTAIYHLKNNLNGPCKDGSGAPFLALLSMIGTGRHEHFLKNTIGPMKTWAFSTTSEDVALRDKLYSMMPPPDARKALAKRFPSGSAREEIVKRANERVGGDRDVIVTEDDKKKAKESVVTDLAKEVYRLWAIGNGQA